MMVAFQKLRCQLAYFNSADHRFGSVGRGESTGLFRDLLERKVDLLAGSQFIFDTYLQVGSLGKYSDGRRKTDHVTGHKSFRHHRNTEPHGGSEPKAQIGQVQADM